MPAIIGSRKAKAYAPLLPVNDGMKRLKHNKKCKWSNIVIIFWMISLALVILVYLGNFLELKSFVSFSKISLISKFAMLPINFKFLDGYYINTPGCRIPKMDPFDPTVTPFVSKPKPIICNTNLPPLFVGNSNSLIMMRNNLRFYDGAQISDVHCCYQEFWRKAPVRKAERDQLVSYSKHCSPLTSSGAFINKEFIKVICKNRVQDIFYEDYFAFVPFKKEVERRTDWNTKPNVLILGLDAVSRLNFQRQFPNTYRYLTMNLGAIELLGYNKVEDNTFPNLLPLLKGMTEHELRMSCWPTTTSRFDKCTFLWDDFSKNNYVTAFGEDCGHLGFFNYQKYGFSSKQPSDYYFTGFNVEIERRIGHHGDGNCYQCVGGREVFKVTLDYIRNFVTGMSLASMPYFGFFWETALTHDYLNRAALGDSSYLDLLEYLNSYGLLTNTVLIVMSDHGIRAGNIRETHQGQLEERLPLVLISLPNWLKEEYPAAVRNLDKNQRGLTTPFDLHETLKDLLDLNNLKNPGKILNSTRGYSLFKEIPLNRTCADAGIPIHWCTCQSSEEVMTNNKQVVAAADFAIANINFQLKRYAQCEKLVLDSILHARILFHDTYHYKGGKYIKDYNITLRTLPGDTVFGVTVRLKGGKHQLLATGYMDQSDKKHFPLKTLDEAIFEILRDSGMEKVRFISRTGLNTGWSPRSSTKRWTNHPTSPQEL